MTPRDPHQDVGVPGTRPGEGSLPKPSRDDATAAGEMEEMEPGASSDDSTQRFATGRRNPEASLPAEEQPPHVTENDEDAEVQDELESPDDVPVLPANASGQDQVSSDDQSRVVDAESMYDRRPEEDKDWKP